ncbi:MAG: 50S ribosomal protein L4 [Bacteroidota bacterium]|jgi:large subunit ribosomal protein L4
MELKVYKIDGSETSKTVALNDAIFNIEPNDHVIWLDVKQILANRRQGTHSSLEKSTVSGSTRKIKKQKGTGGARAGSIKSPLFPGGARAFGPHPRDYSFKINKKVKQLARYSALTYKCQNSKILVLEDYSLETPKTKQMINLLNNFNLVDKKTLFVVSESIKNVYLSSRNLKKVKTINVSDLNTYEVLNAETVIFFESSIANINNLNTTEE